MRENYWINCSTLTEQTIYNEAGSPRSWLLRALNTTSWLPDVDESSLAPSDISVAGLWRREPGFVDTLPDLGKHKALYRYFNLNDNLTKTVPGSKLIKPYLGIAVAVPYSDVIKTLRQFHQAGAVWVWWSRPIERKERVVKKTERVKIDPARAIKLFERGMSVRAVAKELNSNDAAVRHHYGKWKKINEQA